MPEDTGALMHHVTCLDFPVSPKKGKKKKKKDQEALYFAHAQLINSLLCATERLFANTNTAQVQRLNFWVLQ